MSGGHWNYMDQWLRKQGSDLKATFDFLAAAEHELDWGICCDTCLECAKRRVAEGLIRYFDGDFQGAIAIARDRNQNQCSGCTSEQPEEVAPD